MTADAIAQETKRWLAYAQQDMDVASELAAAGKGYTHAICYHGQRHPDIRGLLLILLSRTPYKLGKRRKELWV